MTHTQIKGIASQIARRVQAGLARRPRVNIKTLAAALALTVVGAGSAHASCTYHFVVHNQSQENHFRIYELFNYAEDGPKKKANNFSQEIAAGEVRDFSTRLDRPANKSVTLAVKATKGEAIRDKDSGDITNFEEFKASSSESCYTSFQKKQAGNPVTIVIK